ncbi:type II toxin-antitoxin system VapC family toxin [Allonocardiopsis opalescens]|uniref:PIN domain-containing protein n=1 Tax=Allonocardiopsis opalescens TaxID=1144618 RepID=A0A2T0PSJ0_9ACTN|nr:PIN domain-containing protein [Allonocardiopsis opalescens]PRX91864.1 hypothetical protein CLV72_11349 [Allonocardiopsis opalescens]
MADGGSTGATLVDSSVLLDLITDDPEWGDWSAQALGDAADQGPLVINPVIFAEVSMRYTRIEDLDQVLPEDDFIRSPIPWAASFLAGKCLERHRREGGGQAAASEFLVGAHAAVSGLRLLSREVRRYREYFPTVRLIAPPAS